MRKLAGTLLAVAIAVVGVVGLIAFFNGRDSSTTDREPVATQTGTTAGGDALLKSGNVVLRYSDRAFAPRLRALATALGAPDSPALREAGQAVVLRSDPQAAGVVAQAYGHDLTVPAPDDPQLRPFVERWLGQGAAG